MRSDTAARARRIMIIGSPGSGKSTLAQSLGTATGLPVFHMDREVHWRPGWQERPCKEKPALVQAIADREAWVFEGGHSSSYAARLERATVLIWLDVPLALRLWRVLGRTIRERGRTRPDLPEKCPERLDMLPGFVWFILRTARRSAAKQRALFEQATCEKHRLASARDVETYLRGLT